MENLALGPDKTFHLALYNTVGNRRKMHCLVIYLAVDRDWGSLQLSRNGHKYWPLVMAPMTVEAEAYCQSSHRATSLQFTGVPPADAEGLKNDLRTLGYDEATVERFSLAAKSYWPTGQQPAPKQRGERKKR